MAFLDRVLLHMLLVDQLLVSPLELHPKSAQSSTVLRTLVNIYLCYSQQTIDSLTSGYKYPGLVRSALSLPRFYRTC